jgi:hypothetical protein
VSAVPSRCGPDEEIEGLPSSLAAKLGEHLGLGSSAGRAHMAFTFATRASRGTMQATSIVTSAKAPAHDAIALQRGLGARAGAGWEQTLPN